MEKAKPHPIADGMPNITMASVVVGPVDSLRLLYVVADIGEQLILLGHALGHGRHPQVAWLVGANSRRVTAVRDLERSLLECRLIGSVVDILRPGKPPEPLLWTISYETSKVHNNDLINSLRLSIRLGDETPTSCAALSP